MRCATLLLSLVCLTTAIGAADDIIVNIEKGTVQNLDWSAADFREKLANVMTSKSEVLDQDYEQISGGTRASIQRVFERYKEQGIGINWSDLKGRAQIWSLEIEKTTTNSLKEETLGIGFGASPDDVRKAAKQKEDTLGLRISTVKGKDDTIIAVKILKGAALYSFAFKDGRCHSVYIWRNSDVAFVIMSSNSKDIQIAVDRSGVVAVFIGAGEAKSKYNLEEKAAQKIWDTFDACAQNVKAGTYFVEKGFKYEKSVSITINGEQNVYKIAHEGEAFSVMPDALSAAIVALSALAKL